MTVLLSRQLLTNVFIPNYNCAVFCWISFHNARISSLCIENSLFSKYMFLTIKQNNDIHHTVYYIHTHYTFFDVLV